MSPRYSRHGSTRAALTELRQTTEVPIGLEVQTFHAGQMRTGKVIGLAAKRSYNRQEPHVVVEFPELRGTMQERKIMPLRDVVKGVTEGRAGVKTSGDPRAITHEDYVI